MKYFLYMLLSLLLISSCDKSRKLDNEKDNDARSKIIQASEINDKIKLGSDIAIKNATIIGDIDFTNASESNYEAMETRRHYVNSAITFYNCTFKGKIISVKNDKKNVHLVSYSKCLNFIKCTFQDKIKINNSLIEGLVNFRDNDFQEAVEIIGSTLNFSNNYFTKNNFQKQVKFIGNSVRGRISFFESTFFEHVIFQNNTFYEQAQFSSIIFHKTSDFSGTKAKAEIAFNYTKFNEKTFFNNSVFGFRTDFLYSEFKKEAEFKNIIFPGHVRYNNSTINTVINFEGSVFTIQIPSTKNINLSKDAKIILKNTVYLQNKAILMDDFIKK